MSGTTVLVPLDGSIVSEAALPYAEAFAAAGGGPLRLLAVVEREPGGLSDIPADVRAHLEHLREQSLEGYLGLTAGALRDRGAQVTTALVKGEPVDEILARADEDDVLAVVMATHGRGGIDRWLVGSVADKVLRMCTRPVLLVRPPETHEPARKVSFHRVMVPLDGSPLAEAALAPAGQLAAATGAEVVLVRAEPWLSSMVPVYGYLPDIDRMDTDAAAEAKAYLEGVRGRLPEGVRVETIVLRGAPSDMLVKFALHERVDLVVMATHGRGGLRRLVVGSSADRMVRSGAPVLLVRPPAGAAEADTSAGQPARRCASCGRLITAAVQDESRCPRCQTHLHACANCVFWDTLACVLQRAEAHDLAWAGRGCPRFMFRETTVPVRAARGTVQRPG